MQRFTAQRVFWKNQGKSSPVGQIPFIRIDVVLAFRLLLLLFAGGPRGRRTPLILLLLQGMAGLRLVSSLQLLRAGPGPHSPETG